MTNYDKESEIENLVKFILQESMSIEGIKFKIEQDYQEEESNIWKQ